MPHGQDRNEGVQVVGGRTHDGVERLFLLQHQPEIFILGTTEIPCLLGVLLLDQCLQRRTPSHTLVVEPFETDRFHGIGQGDDLRVGFAEQILTYTDTSRTAVRATLFPW